MEKENIMTLIQADGTKIEANVLLFFELNENGKHYVIYTFDDGNSANPDDYMVVNASAFVKTEDGYQLENMSDEEWNQVKEVMKEVIKEEE